MSIPSPYQNQSSSEPAEDCRDYLRTGRCKYGASCKYNHPPNVQSGGGMKSPINPSEPLFPVRPNEPVCQYYMKHGTCKFGQACKFHHPSQDVGVAQARTRDSEPFRLQWSGPAGFSSSDTGGFQFLPQRPGEPNCIFFLKNGKCKYGATCRYHHPQNAHAQPQAHERRTSTDSRRFLDHSSHGPKASISHRLQYITPLPTAAFQSGHFVVSEGAVAFVSLEGPPTQQSPNSPISSHRTTIDASSNNATSPMCPAHISGTPVRLTGSSRDFPLSSSSASVSSSYDTAMSSMDLHGTPSLGEPPSSLRHRFNRNSSANNLASYGSDHNNSRGRQHLSRHSEQHLNFSDMAASNDASLPTRITPGPVNGSDTESSSVYFDSYGGTGTFKPPRGMRMREARSSSFDHTHRNVNSRQDIHKSMSVPEHLSDGSLGQYSLHGSPLPAKGSRPTLRKTNEDEDDEGMSMMTSALLTMLDTTAEEGAPAHFEDDFTVSAPVSMPHSQLRNQVPSRTLADIQSNFQPETDYPQGAHSMTPFHSQNEFLDSQPISPQSLSRRAAVFTPNAQFIPEPPTSMSQNYGNSSDDTTPAHWSPSWGRSHRSQLERTNATAMLQGQQSPPHDSSHNVGLFLP